MCRFFHSFVMALIFVPIVVGNLTLSFAQVMQSPSYRIQSDSINIGGGLSSSTSYTLESTAGELATGPSDSTSYGLRAGYQQMHEVYIAISASADVTMAPSIPGVTGGSSYGSTTVTVTTDSLSGYELTIKASNAPALNKDSDSIADYVPAGDPDFAFTFGAADAYFGFTPEGVDIVQLYKDGTGTCNNGTGDTESACWDGLSTTAQTIASASTSNHPSGSTTTVRFQVGVGGLVIQPSGTYTATTTLTALPL